VRATAHFPIGQYEFYGRCEIFLGNIREPWANFLVGSETHAITSNVLRILDPSPAKRAVPVEDEQRPVERIFIHIRLTIAGPAYDKASR
jgi:hypothetical protein